MNNLEDSIVNDNQLNTNMSRYIISYCHLPAQRIVICQHTLLSEYITVTLIHIVP